MATSLQRQHLKGLCLWFIANEPLLGYSQGPRRMELVKLTEQQIADAFARKAVFEADCSGFATALCKLAGLADPNGRNYDGSGFTGTMLATLPHYTDPAAANVGALVVFSHPGVPTGDHVATVIGPGKDPWLCSHGSESGPKRIRLSTELAAQRAAHGLSTATFLNVSDL